MVISRANGSKDAAVIARSDGIDAVAVSIDGSILSGSTTFSTNNIEEASATVTYIGAENSDGKWYVKKIDTTTGVAFGHATITNNAAVATYAAAWAARVTLTYGRFSEAF
jgi:signal recognition particle receptor subunit beta